MNLIGDAVKYSARRPNPHVEMGYGEAEGEYFASDNRASLTRRRRSRLGDRFTCWVELFA